jgi:hypothetical protein
MIGGHENWGNFKCHMEWAPWGGQLGEKELTVEPGIAFRET